MRILVVGVGSIGARHMNNLVEHGHEVYVVDINREKVKIAASIAKETFYSLDEALKIKPNAAFICTYSNDHIVPAIKCANAGCHLFVEKPLSLSLDGIDELIEIIDKKNLISMVGCNMRFHPAISYVHDILTKNPFFSKKLWGNFEFGFYLPFDKKDYQNTYKAKKNMGGNLIFDGIHELDCAVWFFGKPVEVVCDKSILSSLKIDTEDHVEMVVKFESGTMCTIHMDYLQHGYSRRCKVVCEEGTIVWDFAQGNIGVITTVGKEWVWKEMELEICYNQMYIDEINYFIDCVSSRTETFNSVKQSLSALKLALLANKSCNTNVWERIE
ncbi:MAG: Gfo/Idh/MocA family oxidoreductase [Deltaproteobacteria bacterium]|nr:Gfo/Idh/MocA family oxidoreductase [Deltaproteobacteria bacterium]